MGIAVSSEVSTHGNWYADPEMLLGALRASRRPGTRAPNIPGYRELTELKRGGQGVVFTATQSSTKRRVAIKVLAGGAFASTRSRRRFEREIDLAASIDHPNIVRIYDSGETADGNPYFVMEYIEGVPLDALFPAGGVGFAEAPAAAAPFRPVRDTVRLFIAICDAVSYAHQRGVIHRDLKPSNIRIDASGAPHVLDFGLAKGIADDAADQTQMSVTGEFMGSLPWASPEQAEGDPDAIDVRTDVYSLGVMMFQALTGRFPYSVIGPLRSVLDTIQNAPPAPPRSIRPELDDEISTIILKCLEKAPERRYQGAGELTRDLRHYLAGEPIEAKRDSGWYTLRKTIRRYRWPVAGFLTLLGLSAIAAITMTLLYRRAVAAEKASLAARDEAQREAQTAQQISNMLSGILHAPTERGREARVADTLDAAVRRLDAEKATLQPRVEAALRDKLGLAYGALGVLDAARQQVERGYEIRKTHLPADSLETSESRASRAWLLFREGKLVEAEAEYRNVLTDRIRHYGEESRPVAQVRNDFAVVLEGLAKIDEAEALYQQALDYWQEHVSPNDANVTSALGNLAGIRHWKGDYEGAEKLMRERLERCRTIHGADHVETLTAMNNLSSLLLDRGQPAEAVELGGAAYEGRVRVLGPGHPDTLTARTNYSMALASVGRNDESLRHYEEALRIALAALGPDHAATANIRNNLAVTYSDLGRLDEAEQMYAVLLEYRRRVLGPKHPETLTSTNNLGTLLMNRGKAQEAAALFCEVANQREAQFGKDDQTRLTALCNYAVSLRDCGRPDEADGLFGEVIERRTRVLGPAHPETFVARYHLLFGRVELGRGDEVLAELRRLRDDAAAALGERHLIAMLCRLAHARAALTREMTPAAEAELLAVVALMSDVLGPAHPRTQSAMQRVVESYARFGRTADAEAWREKRAATSAPASQESSR